MLKSLFRIAVCLFIGITPLVNAEEQPTTLNNLDNEEYNEQLSPTKLILTVPKCGTHLIQKLLGMIIGQKVAIWRESISYPVDPTPIVLPKYGAIVFSHIYPCFDEEIQNNSDHYINVLMIRDPRDTFVSWMNYRKTISPFWGEAYASLSDDDKLSYVIRYPDQDYGVRTFYQRAIEWMKNPNVLVCRFEDLVGPNGGGDSQLQENTIRQLIEHLGYPLSEERIKYIIENLYGGTATFFSGQINSWPKYFNEYNKQLFKEEMGDILISLGYEQDDNW